VAIVAMAAYPLSLRNLPGRSFFSFAILFTMLFNGGLVPTYMIYTMVFHIKNTYWALLVPNLLFSSFNCIIVRTYLQSNVPSELYESAKIDGASEFQIFRRIVLPLGKPIFVTVGVFAGLNYWNDWTNGLYYISDQSKYSIQQVLNVMVKNIEYLTKYGRGTVSSVPSISLRMAIAFAAMLPILILYPFLTKYFEKGIAVGAVKG
jgi:putative aldouronate transport system permease protein